MLIPGRPDRRVGARWRSLVEHRGLLVPDGRNAASSMPWPTVPLWSGRCGGVRRCNARFAVGVTLLSVLEAGRDADVGSWRSSPTSTPAWVDAAVDDVGSMSFGDLIDAAVYTAVIESGPWITDAPTNVASAYRHAEARTSIAEAVNDRFGEALHAPLDRAARQWWTDGSSWFEQLMPLFRNFERVYRAGQFTWAACRASCDDGNDHRAERCLHERNDVLS